MTLVIGTRGTYYQTRSNVPASSRGRAGAAIDKLPFSVYDFFACLSSGFLVIAAADYAFNHTRAIGRSHPFFLDLVLVIGAYILGHAIAELSSLIYERGLVAKKLGYPTDNLLGRLSAGTRVRTVLRSYFAPLPDETQNRIRERAQARGFEANGHGLFYHCHAIVKRDPVVLDRLSTFLNLYGFARNNSAAALIAAPVLVVGAFAVHSHAGAKLLLAVASILVAFVLFLRYLKFFRLYAVEVLVTYAETAP